MLELLSLTFKNIATFDSEQTVNFEDKAKMIQIDGNNEDTGGSSGAGKSSIAHALDYLLNTNDTPATVLKSRNNKLPMEVTGNFKYNNQSLEIKRSTKTGLEILLDDEKTCGNTKLAEELLDSIIGIPRDIFGKMIHQKQNKGGFFFRYDG